MSYETKDGEIVFNYKKDAFDRAHYELDKAFEFITDTIYDEEGEFHHEWSDGDKIRITRIFNLLESAKEGFSVVEMENGWI